MNKINFRKHVRKLVEERTAFLKSENEKLKEENKNLNKELKYLRELKIYLDKNNIII